jgi:uncharacterized membrane protein
MGLSGLARIWIASAVYALVYFALGADRYATYHSGADLGLFTQSIASVFHGFSNTTEGGSHFTFHFSPILYLCAPFLLAAKSPLALVALQAVAGALVAPAVFLLVRPRVAEGLALGIACVALLYPPLAGVTFADFHENGFAPAAIAWLVWAVDARRWTLAVAFLALLLGVKEDEAVVVGFASVFALLYFVRRRERAGIAFSAGALAASVAVFLGFFTLVRPLAGATEAWSPLHFYDWSPLHDRAHSTPWWSLGRLTYVLEAAVPLAFAPFATPAIALALPGLAMVLSSHESIVYTMGQHYAGVWVGGMLVAFALGVARIAEARPRAAAIVVRASLVLCALNLLFASPTHWGHYLRARTAHDALLDRELAALPPQIEVGTHDELFAHLGFDPHASLSLARDPRYALYDTRAATSYWVERDRPRLEAESARGAARLLWERDGLRLYERRPP